MGFLMSDDDAAIAAYGFVGACLLRYAREC